MAGTAISLPETGTRVAVLGGTGWLGRHTCTALARRGYEPVVVARNRALRPGPYPFLAVDLAEASTAQMSRLLHEYQVAVLVNATDAANATDGWRPSEQAMERTNVAVVQRLVAAALTLPWRARMIHIGTILEYGTVPAGELINERRTPRPYSAYTTTKLAGSQTVLDAARAGHLDGLVLRVTNICGPQPSPASFPAHLVRLLSEAIASRGRLAVTVTADRRDFIDVRDVAEAVVHAVASSATGHALNIGSGTASDMSTVVRLFVAGAGFPTERVDVDHRQVESLGGTWTCADVRLAEQLIGWRPTISLADSLRDMWQVAAAEQQPA